MFTSAALTRLQESQQAGRRLQYHSVVFPDLAPAGARHIVNFSPPVTSAPDSASRLSSNEDDSCIKWILRQSGIDARLYRWETLRRRVPGLLRRLRVASLPEARASIQRNRTLLRPALNALMIGVTTFFRDPTVFQTIADRLLPDIADRGAEVRIWSAGCSDGSELFSLAILMAELKVAHRAKFVGSDCRAEALQAAQSGQYGSDALVNVSPLRRERYFRQQDRSWQLTDWLRSAPTWRKADVLSVCEPGPWDLILCRNLAIYLQPAAASHLWTQLRSALRIGGVLVVGKAERPGVCGLRQIAPCLYQRDRS